MNMKEVEFEVNINTIIDKINNCKHFNSGGYFFNNPSLYSVQDIISIILLTGGDEFKWMYQCEKHGYNCKSDCKVYNIIKNYKPVKNLQEDLYERIIYLKSNNYFFVSNMEEFTTIANNVVYKPNFFDLQKKYINI